MANWGQVDFSGLVELRDKIENLQEFLDDFYIYATKEIAQIIVNKVISKTPVDTEYLAKHWTTGEFKKEGDCYSIEVINPIEYAEFVEFGHRKRNDKGWVEGKFMLTIAERDVQRDLENIIMEKLKKFVAEALQ